LEMAIGVDAGLFAEVQATLPGLPTENSVFARPVLASGDCHRASGLPTQSRGSVQRGNMLRDRVVRNREWLLSPELANQKCKPDARSEVEWNKDRQTGRKCVPHGPLQKRFRKPGRAWRIVAMRMPNSELTGKAQPGPCRSHFRRSYLVVHWACQAARRVLRYSSWTAPLQKLGKRVRRKSLFDGDHKLPIMKSGAVQLESPSKPNARPLLRRPVRVRIRF
jgi:hypothetical protein